MVQRIMFIYLKTFSKNFLQRPKFSPYCAPLDNIYVTLTFRHLTVCSPPGISPDGEDTAFLQFNNPLPSDLSPYVW